MCWIVCFERTIFAQMRSFWNLFKRFTISIDMFCKMLIKIILIDEFFPTNITHQQIQFRFMVFDAMVIPSVITGTPSEFFTSWSFEFMITKITLIICM